jgi:hypothetical protein
MRQIWSTKLTDQSSKLRRAKWASTPNFRLHMSNCVSVRMPMNRRLRYKVPDSRRTCWQLRNITASLWSAKPVLLVLANEWVNNKKSPSARRLALPLGNLDPKETPEVIALGGALL